MSRASIAAFESGTRRADSSVIDALAAALDVKPDVLIDIAPVRLLSVAEAAAALRCSPDTVHRRIADGTLVASRIGRLVRVHADSVARASRSTAVA